MQTRREPELANYLDKDFQKALDFDLKWEGISYEDVPGDPGGPTRAGITWEDGNAWRKAKGLPALSIAEARAMRLGYLTPDVISKSITFTTGFRCEALISRTRSTKSFLMPL